MGRINRHKTQIHSGGVSMKRKLRVLFMMVVMACILSFASLTALAAVASNETEDNNTRDKANQVVLNDTIFGNLSTSSDVDWYKFVLTEAGVAKIDFGHNDLTSSNTYWRVWVYDSEGNGVTGSDIYYSFKGDGSGYTLPDLGLAAGTYYIKVSSYNHSNSTYSLKVGFAATEYYEKEANKDRASATQMQLNKAYKGSLYLSDDIDWYKFVLSKDDAVTVTFKHKDLESSNRYWKLTLCDSTGTELDSEIFTGNGTEKSLTSQGLAKGTYYVKVEDYSYHSNSTYELLIKAPAHDKQTGWQKDANGWWYMRADGTYPKNQWEKIGGYWYHFDNKGYMQTGWLQLGGKWFYLNTNGVMVTGWKQVGGKWYYMDANGVMKTGWLKSGGKWYFLKKSGQMAASEWCGGYWLNKDGTWTYQYKASWKKNAKGWWFGDESGWYAKNTTVKIDGKMYTFDANGYLK